MTTLVNFLRIFEKTNQFSGNFTLDPSDLLSIWSKKYLAFGQNKNSNDFFLFHQGTETPVSYFDSSIRPSGVTVNQSKTHMMIRLAWQDIKELLGIRGRMRCKEICFSISKMPTKPRQVNLNFPSKNREGEIIIRYLPFVYRYFDVFQYFSNDYSNPIFFDIFLTIILIFLSLFTDIPIFNT